MRDGEDVCFWCRSVADEPHDMDLHPGPANVREKKCWVCGAKPSQQHDITKHRNARHVKADGLMALAESGFPEDTVAPPPPKDVEEMKVK